MKPDTLIGRNATRQDAREKATGEFIYGMDFRLPGALESVVLRSPVPHARILKIDAGRAEALKGIRAVILGRDLPEVYMNGPVEDQPPLAVDIVRYFGEPMALVAADTLEIAQEGARLIDVSFEPLPVVTEPEPAMLPGAPLLHPGWKSYVADEQVVRDGNVCCHARLQNGDVERGFAGSDLVVEGDFSTASVHQSHVEPRVATGVLEQNGMVTVYSNTQLTIWTRTQVARVLRMPEDRVRIVPLAIGGGFGSKLYAQIEPFVALLARKTGRAVHMFTPLEEELTAGLPRHPTRIHLKTGVKRDGTIVAHQARMIVDCGAYAGSGPEVAGIGALMLTGPYRLPNVLFDGFAVYTNKTNFGAYRGPGGPQSVFALESHFDVVADRLGIDPLEFRLRNIAGEGDEVANGQILVGVGLKEALEKAAAAIDWGKPSPAFRGKGLALSWWTTTLQKSTVRVSLDAQGRVVVGVGTQEIGTGAVMGVLPQIVAETMGIGMDDVVIDVTDTSKGLWDWGSQGSRTAFNLGRAAQAACIALTAKLKKAASCALGVEAGLLEIKDRSVISRARPEAGISLAALAQSDTRGELSVIYESIPEPAKYRKERLSSVLYPAFHYPHFHCHAAEVEVDPETGQVSVLRFAAAHDIGTAVNPSLIEGQIQGGAAQGIGMALMEEVRYKDGYRTNINWTDYKLPTTMDVPDIKAIIVEHPVAGGGPYGLKGLGEAPAIEPPAAIANAIARAIGVRITSLPMTAEKILKAIRAARSER